MAPLAKGIILLLNRQASGVILAIWNVLTPHFCRQLASGDNGSSGVEGLVYAKEMSLIRFIATDAPSRALNHVVKVNISHPSLGETGESGGVWEVMEKEKGFGCCAAVRFVVWGRCQTSPTLSLSFWYCYSALQHCSNRMDLSLNVCVCVCVLLREGDDTQDGSHRNENEVTACQGATTCRADIEITSMLQRERKL